MLILPPPPVALPVLPAAVPPVALAAGVKAPSWPPQVVKRPAGISACPHLARVPSTARSADELAGNCVQAATARVGDRAGMERRRQTGDEVAQLLVAGRRGVVVGGVVRRKVAA